MEQFVAFFNNLTGFFTSLLERAAELYPDERLPVRPTVLVHSALSSFGRVPRGEQTIVNALMKACAGIHGTLVMPAHSDNPNENGTVPFSRKKTPCRTMGRIPENFRCYRGVRRSAHPHLSFCARGPAAGKITHNHRPESGLGPGSPLDALYRLDALVLMLGTGYDTCSALHLVEYAVDRKRVTAGLKTDRVTCGSAVYRWSGINPDGRRSLLPRLNLKWIRWEDVAFHPEFFPAIGAAFEREHNDCIIRGKLSVGEYRLFRVRDLVDFSIDRYPVLE